MIWPLGVKGYDFEQMWKDNFDLVKWDVNTDKFGMQMMDLSNMGNGSLTPGIHWYEGIALKITKSNYLKPCCCLVLYPKKSQISWNGPLAIYTLTELLKTTVNQVESCHVTLLQNIREQMYILFHQLTKIMKSTDCFVEETACSPGLPCTKVQETQIGRYL